MRGGVLRERIDDIHLKMRRRAATVIKAFLLATSARPEWQRMQSSDTQAMTARIISALHTGDVQVADADFVTQAESALLEAILAALLRGEDVSDLIEPGGPCPRPSTRFVSRFTTCA